MALDHNATIQSLRAMRDRYAEFVASLDLALETIETTPSTAPASTRPRPQRHSYSRARILAELETIVREIPHWRSCTFTPTEMSKLFTDRGMPYSPQAWNSWASKHPNIVIRVERGAHRLNSDFVSRTLQDNA